MSVLYGLAFPSSSVQFIKDSPEASTWNGASVQLIASTYYNQLK